MAMKRVELTVLTRTVIGGLVAALLVGAPVGPSTAKESAVEVRVTEAWIRWLPAGLPGAGYMTVTNTGSATWVLTGATSPAYGRIEFHRTQSTNGMNAMTPVQSITLQPQASVVFKEGGYHLMMMQPTHAVQPGERVPVVLEFAGGRTLTVPFTVRGTAPTAQ